MQQVINALATGSSLALFAVGFTLLFGVLGVLNFAQGSVMVCGAFGGIVVTSSWGWPIGFALLGGVVAGALASLLIELVVFRALRRRGATEFVQLIATIGAGYLIIGIIEERTGGQTYTYPPSDFLSEPFRIGELVIPRVQLIMLVLAVIVMVVLDRIVFKTSAGRMLRAVASDPEIAGAMGVHVSRVWSATFIVAGALAGVTGVFVGLVTQSVTSHFASQYLLIGFTAVVIGGLGNIRGAVVGGLLVGAIQVFGIVVFDSSIAGVLTYAILFLFIVLRPNGLFGTQVRRA